MVTHEHEQQLLVSMSSSYNTTEDKTRQHNTARYDTVRWVAKPYSILNPNNAFQNALDIEFFLRISKQFLFPRNKSVSERNISSSRIRDQKAMNLLLDFCAFSANLRP